MYFDENNNYFNIASDENNYDIDKYIDKDFNIGNIIFNRHSDKLVSPVEGFNRGNLFDNLYSKYKNHVYNIKVNNKKDELLYKIQIHNFAIRDLTLYLDLHTTEIDKINLFNEYNRNLTKLKKEYSDMYSPLCINEVESTNKWTWINNPWPWDKGGNI